MKKWMYGIAMAAMLLLTGCGGVEPEKRAYPLAVSFDLTKDRLQVIYAMANLAVSTGQGKGKEDTGGQQTLRLSGENMEEIMEKYNRTEDYYLDLGHLQAVILGENLLKDQEAYDYILDYLEKNPVVGETAALFRSEDPEEVMKLNGGEMESLGTYLTGIYENRPAGEKRQMVTLRQAYRRRHEKKEPPKMPLLTAGEKYPEISA